MSIIVSALVVGTISLTSCKKDDVKDTIIIEKVENPLEKVVYYISGSVKVGSVGLEGVSVSIVGGQTAVSASDGAYTLEVITKGKFAVKFVKAGYLTIQGEVTIGDNLDKGSTVKLSQALTPMGTPVKVIAKEKTEFEVETDLDVTLNVVIPANALESNTTITVTPYIPAANTEIKDAENDIIGGEPGTNPEPVEIEINAALSTINFLPSGLEFADGKPAVIDLVAPSSTVFFTNVEHLKQNDITQVWSNEGEAEFITEASAYSIKLSSFSNHSIAPKIDVKISVSTSEIASDEIDNLGKTQSANKNITVVSQEGWKIIDDQATISEHIKKPLIDMVISTMGSTEGTKSISVVRKLAVSGDEKIVATYSQSISTYVFSASYMDNSVVKTATIKINSYGMISQTLVKTKGNMQPSHN